MTALAYDGMAFVAGWQLGRSKGDRVRLWSLHPRHLDTRGLLAVWREGLLAQKVLQGRTKGYRHHPQLERFRASRRPLSAIGFYLLRVVEEAARRGYSFDRRRIGRRPRSRPVLKVTRGQLEYEAAHLRAKLRRRAPDWLRAQGGLENSTPHPLFRVVSGGVESWEKRPKGLKTF